MKKKNIGVAKRVEVADGGNLGKGHLPGEGDNLGQPRQMETDAVPCPPPVLPRPLSVISSTRVFTSSDGAGGHSQRTGKLNLDRMKIQKETRRSSEGAKSRGPVP